MTKVTDQGRVNLQVGIASWKKALDTVYKRDEPTERDHRDVRDRRDDREFRNERYGSSSMLQPRSSWDSGYPTWNPNWS